MTTKVVPYAWDWVPCSRYLPPVDPEMGPERSVSVLLMNKWGGFCLAHTQQERDPWEGGEVYPLQWHTSDSEAWDITEDVLCWRSIPDGPNAVTLEYFLSLEKGDE